MKLIYMYQKTAGNASGIEEEALHLMYRGFWFICPREQSPLSDMDAPVEFNGSIMLLGYSRLENELSDQPGSR